MSLYSSSLAILIKFEVTCEMTLPGIKDTQEQCTTMSLKTECN